MGGLCIHTHCTTGLEPVRPDKRSALVWCENGVCSHFPSTIGTAFNIIALHDVTPYICVYVNINIYAAIIENAVRDVWQIKQLFILNTRVKQT